MNFTADFHLFQFTEEIIRLTNQYMHNNINSSKSPVHIVYPD